MAYLDFLFVVDHSTVADLFFITESLTAADVCYLIEEKRGRLSA
jgi:hypothetical protein